MFRFFKISCEYLGPIDNRSQYWKELLLNRAIVQICCSGDIKFSVPELFLIGKKNLGARKIKRPITY